MKHRGKKELGYYAETHMFPSIRILRKNLGKIDSVIQYNEITNKWLNEYANSVKIDLSVFMREKADEYKISKPSSNNKKIDNLRWKNNIVMVYTEFSRILKDLKKEYCLYKDIDSENWINVDSNKKNMDTLNQLIQNSKNKQIKDYPEYFLLDYYRLIRNSTIHSNDSYKVLSQAYKKVIEHTDHFETHYGSLPNELSRINFEDYFLYTRAIKYFMNVVNDELSLTAEEIVQAAKNDNSFKKKLRGCEEVHVKGIRARRIGKIKGYYRNKHFFGKDKVLLNEFFLCFKENDFIDWTNEWTAGSEKNKN